MVFGYVVNTCEESDKQKQARETARIAEQAAKKLAERKANLEKQNLDFFNKNKTAVIAEITNHYKKGDYQKAVTISKKYIKSEDAQLKEIYGKVKSKIDEKREKEILAQLKKVPASQYEKNKNLYKQLMSLKPDNAIYKKKYEYYSAKIEEKRARERRAAERQKKIKEQFSGWDGSHRNLERYIKENMLDPKSYDHVETVYWDKGTYIIVKTTFRGKNAFGGLVINSTRAKVDDNGNLIQIY